MYIKMKNFKIEIITGNLKKQLIVRQKNTNSNSNDDILDSLGLEEVPYKELVPKSKKVNADEKEICSICYSEYIKGEFKRELECNHCFHKKCIDKWLKKFLNCPICRKYI